MIGFQSWFGKNAYNCTFELFTDLNKAKRWVRQAKQTELFRLCKYHNSGVRQLKVNKCATEWCDKLTFGDEELYCLKCDDLMCEVMCR